MANYLLGRMKRKELDDIYDDFSDLSFSEPAAKIRRLDADMLSTVEEMDLSSPSVFGQPMPEEDTSGTVMNKKSITGEAVLPHSLNEERALVVYQPRDCEFTPNFRIDPKLIRGLKNYTFWPGNPNLVQVEEDRDGMESSSGNCLAVVPWVPSRVPATSQGNEVLAPRNELDEEPMEAEEAAGSLMETEEDKGQAGNIGVGGDGFHQRQQYCMIPQPLQCNSTPIMWS